MDLSENGWWVAVPADVARCPGLSVTARLLHVILMSYRNPQKPQEPVFPRVDTLARMLCASESTVKRAMRELVDAKVVERKARMGRSTQTFLKATGFDLPRGHPRPLVEVTHDPAEEEPAKKSHTPSADKPREEVSENPTTTGSGGDYEFVPAEETVPYRPLARPKKPPSPKYMALGREVMRSYGDHIFAPGLAPPVAEVSAPTLAKAGKTVHALKDSRFAGKSLEELMPLIVARVKTCEPIVRKAINFHWLFCADAPNLARLLNGDWDREQEEVAPKRREIPLEDLRPGMDEEKYWAEKDKEAGNG